MKKILRISLIILASVIVVVVVFLAVVAPPVMAGMAAKTMCSCVFVTGRAPESVRAQELQVFPGLPNSDITINNTDSTVTSSILWKTSKAIFRKGLGCTLLAEQSEEK